MKEIKQNPFSLYDFLGYFIPGAVFLYVIEAVFQFANLESNEHYYVPFILASYVIGHILSFLSTLFVEKMVHILYNYPSETLVNGYKKPLNKETVSITRLIIKRTILFGFMLPVYIIERCVFFVARNSKGDLFYNERWDDLNIKAIHNACEYIHGSLNIEGNSFKQIYHWVYEVSPSHRVKIQNYVALYGFTRTMTFVLIIIWWMFIFMSWVYASEGKDLSISSNYVEVIKSIIFNIPFCIVLFCGSLVSFVLFAEYVKFYRRFTEEVYMASSAILRNTGCHSKLE